MAENHYVDSGDQHTAAEGAPDHSELTTLYRDPPKVELEHWMHENERQAALETKRATVTTNLRKSAILIGLALSIPVALGIIFEQFFTTTVNLVNAIPILFLIIFGFAGYFALSIHLFKWVAKTFHNHTLRALPISLTTLLCLFLLLRPTFYLTSLHIGGLAGYATGLGALLVIGTLITTISVLVWTSQKLPNIFKILVLVIFFGGSVASAFLI